jgi:hypothetical protein
MARPLIVMAWPVIVMARLVRATYRGTCWPGQAMTTWSVDRTFPGRAKALQSGGQEILEPDISWATDIVHYGSCAGRHGGIRFFNVTTIKQVSTKGGPSPTTAALGENACSTAEVG